MIDDEFVFDGRCSGALEAMERVVLQPGAAITTLIVFALLITDVYVFVPKRNSARMSAAKMMRSSFQPSYADPDDIGVLYPLSGADDVNDFMARTWKQWENLPQNPSGQWEHAGAPTIEAEMRVAGTWRDLITSSSADRGTTKVVCEITASNPTGPFKPFGNATPSSADACSGVAGAWARALKAEVVWPLRSATPTALCEDWSVSQSYDLRHRSGIVGLRVRLSHSQCGGGAPDGGRLESTADGQKYAAVCVVTAALALFDAMLRLRSCDGGDSHPGGARGGPPDSHPGGARGGPPAPMSPRSLSVPAMTDVEGAAASALPALSVMSAAAAQFGLEPARRCRPTALALAFVLSDGVVVASRVLCILRAGVGLSAAGILAADAVAGFACLTTSISLLAHLRDAPSRLYLFVGTLRKGLPSIANHLVAVLPLFLSFTMLGTHVFGGTAAGFSSVDKSLVSLFAVINGDEVHDTFAEVFAVQDSALQVLSRVYLFSFVCVGIYCVINTFLALMEEAYFQVKSELLLDLREANFRETRKPH
eukprot:TRINITY_DN1949_c1_g1_i1.p1 TRINITY_DN1949_c1_g1~~TRINITY_DN1949_c1_g1_i1.p1  ORF type:complete len:537 (+),score=107.71 TRINITY_DN1949_c1_g1_i1:74-1684(+)